MLTLDQLAKSGEEDRAALLELADEARSYLEAQTWCRSVKELLYGDGMAKVAAFSARVERTSGAEEDVWVVVGDLPPLHVETNGGRVSTPAEAMFMYTRLLIAWYYAAKEGKKGPGIPVLVSRHGYRPIPMNRDMINLIDRRIELMMGTIIPWVLGEPDDQ